MVQGNEVQCFQQPGKRPQRSLPVRVCFGIGHPEQQEWNLKPSPVGEWLQGLQVGYRLLIPPEPAAPAVRIRKANYAVECYFVLSKSEIEVHELWKIAMQKGGTVFKRVVGMSRVIVLKL